MGKPYPRLSLFPINHQPSTINSPTTMQNEIHRRLTLGLTIQPPSRNRRRIKRRRSHRLTFQGWPYVLSVSVVIACLALIASIFIA